MATRGRALSRELVEISGAIIRSIEATLKRGDPYPDCIAKYLLQHQGAEGLDDLDITVLCGAFMIGGVETVSSLVFLGLNSNASHHNALPVCQTSSVKQWFAAHIPTLLEVQAKARLGLDSVCGRDRLPTADDEAKMPYIHAIVKVSSQRPSCTVLSS